MFTSLSLPTSLAVFPGEDVWWGCGGGRRPLLFASAPPPRPSDSSSLPSVLSVCLGAAAAESSPSLTNCQCPWRRCKNKNKKQRKVNNFALWNIQIEWSYLYFYLSCRGLSSLSPVERHWYLSSWPIKPLWINKEAHLSNERSCSASTWSLMFTVRSVTCCVLEFFTHKHKQRTCVKNTEIDKNRNKTFNRSRVTWRNRNRASEQTITSVPRYLKLFLTTFSGQYKSSRCSDAHVYSVHCDVTASVVRGATEFKLLTCKGETYG